MELTKDEKEVLKNLITRELKEVEDPAVTTDSTPAFLVADVRYDVLLKDLLKKLG